jgi:predicted nucleic-acid-binding protein
VKEAFLAAEREGRRFLITWPVVLETIWVLSAVYDFERKQVLEALELLAQMPILDFEDYDGHLHLIRLGQSTMVHLPDLVIGLSSKSRGAESTLTFEKGLDKTALFERISMGPAEK